MQIKEKLQNLISKNSKIKIIVDKIKERFRYYLLCTVIILPETLYIKKMKKYQEIVTMNEEYNIYYRNIIHPYNEKWDVFIKCEYGKNFGDCWRLSNYTGDVNEFDFELIIYDEYGEKLASKKSRIVMVERHENVRTKVLFFGDSMTHSQVYINHICETLRGIETIGTRCFDGNIRHEGRGGWSYEAYLKHWFNRFGLSPFLFPKDISGADYYGNMEFVEAVEQKDAETYQYYGYTLNEIKVGQYYTRENKLYKKAIDKDELISENPCFEFDFSKYLERYKLDKPEIVSILLGANDLQICLYEESEERIKEFIENTMKVINNIHECDDNIKVVVNLPVLGAEQYAWGMQLGCIVTEKMYRFNIMNASKRLIEEFDGRQAENIYIAPMIACVDPTNGFASVQVNANLYTENTVKKQCNWVHPNHSGYRQMGDALASVIEHIRSGEK